MGSITLVRDAMFPNQWGFWREIEGRLRRGEVELSLIPFTASRVSEITRNPLFSADALQKAVMSDLVIASQVLRVANSSDFSFRDPICSLKQAIIRLGYSNVLKVVQETVLSTELMGTDYRGFHSEHLWEHSLGCAMICRVIAATVNYDSEEAFTAGLIHDIGKVILFQERHLLSNDFCFDDDVFYDLMRTFHSVTGQIAAESWNFPTRISDAIGGHHNLAAAGNAPRLAAIINLGNHLCHFHGIGVAPRKIDLLETASVKILEMKSFKLNALNEVALEAFEVTNELYPAEIRAEPGIIH